MQPIRVGIVGGGIGGAAAALALERAGIEATIYERAERLLEVGAGMMLWPNATRVLREWGLLDEIAREGGASTRFHVRSASGATLLELALGTSDAPALCIRRSLLLAALLRRIPIDRIRLGHQLTRVERLNRGARLHFANGATAEYDAVIGADGIRSRVRDSLFGRIDPVYRGYTVWRGVAHLPRASAATLETEVNSETWGAGHRFGILATGPDVFTWYATANRTAGQPDPPCGRKRELLEMFQQWHAPIPDLLNAMDDSAILKNAAYDLRPLRAWGKGSITLLGDAAHPATPNLGQGGGMALEDAAVLAKCLQAGSRVEPALRRYEALRRSRTRHIQSRSRLMGSIGQWQWPALVAGRRIVTRLLPAEPFEWNLRRVYAYET
jgi:2-polyprenyl-6-methoxyphenol hydroxylase-like FAD-dependent oxidoreductase